MKNSNDLGKCIIAKEDLKLVKGGFNKLESYLKWDAIKCGIAEKQASKNNGDGLW